jgi:hypothetical protein
MQEFGCVQIARKQQLWRDRLRAYKIVIDDAVVGAIRNGEEKLVLVQPGEHQLRLKIDWTGSSSEQFSVEPNERVCFRCKAAHWSLLALPDLIRSIWNRKKWIKLERCYDSNIDW